MTARFATVDDPVGLLRCNERETTCVFWPYGVDFLPIDVPEQPYFAEKTPFARLRPAGKDGQPLDKARGEDADSSKTRELALCEDLCPEEPVDRKPKERLPISRRRQAGRFPFSWGGGQG